MGVDLLWSIGHLAGVDVDEGELCGTGCGAGAVSCLTGQAGED